MLSIRISGVHGSDGHSHFCSLFLTHLVLILTFCDFGKADIVVYEGSTKVREFPDIELVYTETVRWDGNEGLLVEANPLHACINISKPPDLNTSLNWFVLISGNSCNFKTKVYNAKSAGYSVAIIYTYRGRVESSSNKRGHNRFYSDMPAVVIKTEDGITLKEHYLYTVSMLYRLVIFPNNAFSIVTFLLMFSILAGLILVIMLAFTITRFFQQSHTEQNGRLSSHHLKQLQTSIFTKGDCYETCAICLEDYKDQEKLRILPCCHAYHTKCIDPWLTNNRCICPVCKRKIILAGESSTFVDSNFEETTPLLQAQRTVPRGTFNYVNPPAGNPNVSSQQTIVGNEAQSI